MRSRPLLALVLLLALPLAADKAFVMPKTFHANTYPAHEEHTNEKVSIAADPYDMPDKAAAVFSIDWAAHELLPIELIISNDSDTVLDLTQMTVKLVTVKRTKLTPFDKEDVERRVSEPGKPPGGVRPYPIPLPRKKMKPSISKDQQNEITQSFFYLKEVDPHSTAVGFLYFDVTGLDHPLAGATLNITGLRDAKGQELFYFEIPLEKYLSYHP